MLVLALDTSTWRLEATIVRLDDGHVDVLSQFAEETGKGMHSRLLPRLLNDLLHEAGLRLEELDGLAVGLGPGSFTGLRTGLATVMGIAYSAKIPLAGVSSLASMVVSARPSIGPSAVSPGHRPSSPLFVPVLDARRDQVYAGFYRLEEGKQVSSDAPPPSSSTFQSGCSRWSLGACDYMLVQEEADAVLAPDALLARLADLKLEPVIFGDGAARHEQLSEESDSFCLSVSPSALGVAVLSAPQLAEGFDVARLGEVRPAYVRQNVVG